MRLDERETLITIVRDITERKHVEEQLRKLSRAVEQSPVAVVITGANGLIEYVNPKFTDATGYTADEAIGKNPRILNSGQQPDEFYRDLWETILRGDEWRGEFCNRKKNGELYWEFSPIRNFAGDVTHFVSVKGDVTQRKRTEEELRLAKEAAESANRAKSVFLASMSHELRTPLNGVLGYAQLLQDDPAIGDDQRQNLNSIRSCGEHLLTLINDVLDLSRIESGKLEIHNSPCDLPTMLLDVNNVVSPLAAEKGLQLSFDVSADAPQRLLTDPPKLRQVLVNLLANAVKFTDEGAVTLRIGKPKADEITFQVLDTGAGIPDCKLAEIFEPFRQLEEHSTTAGGTGLGLAISQRLVTALGGSLHATSQVGRGSCFSVTLPLQEAGDSDRSVLSHDVLRDLRGRILAPN